MSIPNIQKARAWAEEQQRHHTNQSEWEVAAVEAIRSLPDQWIDAEKLREEVILLVDEPKLEWPRTIAEHENVAPGQQLNSQEILDSSIPVSGESEKQRVYDDGGPFPPGRSPITFLGRTS